MSVTTDLSSVEFWMQPDEQRRPLASYRAEELLHSHACFFGPDRSYHEARHRFVHKLGAPCAV